MSKPFVSVVVPIYNRKLWVQELLPTLLSQTYSPDSYEVVFVDNGSTDGAWEFVLEQSSLHPGKIRAYRNDDPIKVPAASRNKGILESKGEFVAFTDSDCLVSPDWLSHIVAAFAPGIGVVEGQTIPVPGDPAPAFTRIKIIDGTRHLFDTCNIAYSKKALLAVDGFARDFYENGYPRYYGEDLDLGYRVKAAGFKTAFAAGAIVMHHNQPQTFLQWLKEPRLVYICPYIALKHPSSRRDLLFANYFLSPSTAAFDLALLASILALFLDFRFLLGCLPFLFVKFSEVGSAGSLLYRSIRVAGGSLRSCVTFAVLASASLRYRSLIL